ncbi:tetratricopeptide repeat protein [Mucilaginibacter terrae]|uniref:Negative regulator of RcsB-dependent stress response n=1 Tax=Mucilaginibacter terrae TaxID=1955052 RepID=A0ABU3GTD8_9SPHI|nr:tetratricopeptide repeat protein [Mucilaginibacter terrae]MDT3403050.1 putative negative regulator of RcsB-dependent stress response [Mucilaginibacter terrae]
MIKRILPTVISLFIGFSSYANFDVNANCTQAYKNILSFKLKAAREQIDREKAMHPQNSFTILLDDYYDYFWMLSTESKTDYDRLKDNKSKRLDKLEDEDKSSPYYNFSLAQVNLHWALLHARFGDNSAAGFAIKRAYSQLNDNQKKFPTFLPDDIPLGMVNVALGALPDGALKSVLNLFGIKGSINTGINLLQNVTAHLPQSAYAMYYDEAVFYTTYLQTDVMNDAQAYQKMLQYTAAMDNSSLLKSYIQGYIALRTGHSAEAIRYFEKAPEGAEYQPYPYLNYLAGLARMNVSDKGAANYFNKFLQTNKGVNYIKDAYLHLAWDALLDGNIKRYTAFTQLVKTKGYTYNEKDKRALTEISDPHYQPALLQARLWFDGGLYEKALSVLKAKEADTFTTAHDKAEYHYRLGRIYEALQNDNNALSSYQQAINTGKGTSYYFAPMSALKAGNIYEQRKDSSKAISYYRMAIDFKNHQQENSIEQKAKEGLKRLKK